MWPLLVILVMCLAPEPSRSQRGVPATPCPTAFKYEHDGTQWYGLVSAPNPPPYGSEMRLVLRLSLNARLPSQYVGKVDLYEHGDVVLNRIRHGQPIYYKVAFPLTYPIPQVVSIQFNERLICYGPPAYGAQVTTLHLHHAFKSGDEFNQMGTVDSVVNGLQMLYGGNAQQQTTTEQPQIVYIDLNNPQNNMILKPRPQPVATTPSPNYEIQIIDPNNPYNPYNPYNNNPPIVIQNKIDQVTTTEVAPTPTTALPFATRIPSNSICGTVRSFVPLITNGKKAVRGDWPWLVAIFWRKRTTPGDIKKEFKCGSTLISKKLIVTAAHCVTTARRTPIGVEVLLLKLGAYDIDDETDEGSITKAASRLHVPDDYDENLNDIALVELRQPVAYTDYIRPICLWGSDDSQNVLWGLNGTVVGWGRDESGQGVLSEPRTARVPIVSTTECRASHAGFFQLTSNATLCAGARDGTGPCTGDSGGGMYLKVAGRWRVRGVVSKALKNENDNSCNLNEYIVYTDVAKFRGWIERVAQGGA